MFNFVIIRVQHFKIATSLENSKQKCTARGAANHCLCCRLRVWESPSAATCCRSVVVVYNYSCVLQIGVAAVLPDNGEAMPVDAAKLIQGTLYQGVKKSRAQSYLANLSLYRGRPELPFLPSNTQAVILQPLGEKGVLIIGGDAIRGFTNSDQPWITLIGEKLEATLAKFAADIPLAVQDTA